MPTYVLLMKLTPEGRARALQDPEYILAAEGEIKLDGVETLGVYAVLGEYDFVTLVEAESNECMARFSLALGVKADVHVTTLTAVPITRLEPPKRGESFGIEDVGLASEAPEPFDGL